ncbi:MAG TPA: phosphatidylserine decarboxylase, partial [Planctomycetota bacterium]|nr:phosphatidylserine decarboxylase [Planctomycetota bacterium]
YWVSAVFAVLFVGLLGFFRDPTRRVPEGPRLLVSPADGRVTDVDECDDPELGGVAKRVSIFLSVLSVHVNRSPCAGRVVSVSYREGKYLNAMKSQSARENESNAVVLESAEVPDVRVRVKQVAGAIARRIVCTCSPGDALERGERIGMIKFGSRTDLCVPVEHLAEVCVKVGDRVHGGRTIIGVLK